MTGLTKNPARFSLNGKPPNAPDYEIINRDLVRTWAFHDQQAIRPYRVGIRPASVTRYGANGDKTTAHFGDGGVYILDMDIDTFTDLLEKVAADPKMLPRTL